MKYGKWIGGGLGWALGGAIGALVGFAIGALFDSGDSDGQGQQSRRTSQGTGPGDFKMSLLVLIACIVKADGIARESEMAIVRRILVSNFGRAEADEAMSILNRLLVQEIDETEVARQIDRNMNYSSKLELLHLLFQIAYAVSIHKAQGLEYRSVKIVITHDVEDLITHNIFYTAVTRTREKLKIYWTPESENKILKNMRFQFCKKDYGILRNKYHDF